MKGEKPKRFPVGDQTDEKINDKQEDSLCSKEGTEISSLFFDKKQGNGKQKFLSKLLKMNFGKIVLITLLYIFQALPTWVIPVATANIINSIVDNISQGVGFTTELINLLLLDGGLVLVSCLLNIPLTIVRTKLYSKMLRKNSAMLKRLLVEKLQSLTFTFGKELESGKIQAKFIRDTESIDSMFSAVVLTIIPNIISLLVYTGIIVYTSIYVAIFFVVTVPLNIIIPKFFDKKICINLHEYRMQHENLINKLSTMVYMMPITKAHGLESLEEKELMTSIQGVERAGIKADDTNASFGSALWVYVTLANFLCLVFCVLLAVWGKIGIGDIALCQSIFGSLNGFVSSTIQAKPSIMSGKEAVNSLSEIMNTKEVEIVAGKTKVNTINGIVKFDHVFYQYPHTIDACIKDFSLDVKQGECIAVVGSSGSGKTTLMNMIIGFLPPSDGSLLIDGQSIKEINLIEYRHNISVVSQNSILFKGSIKENIVYGLNSYSEEQFKKVLEMANINEFIKEMPKGVDSDIGEHGDLLSGGQRQRITIARALMRDPKILILDEATSALDNISEYHVQKAINESIKGRTTFIVAHRLSTIRNADRIVVLEGGVAVEIGTFDQLMEKKGKFYELKKLSELNSKTAQQQLGE